MEIFTKSAQETQAAGREFGANLNLGSVIIFEGDLGAGKTTFIQGIAQGLGVEGRINSPTFIIMREYEINDESSFFHIDLYRLEENIKQELENLGIIDLIKENKHIFAIEWGERARDFLPPSSIKIKFEDLEGDKRKIIING